MGGALYSLVLAPAAILYFADIPERPEPSRLPCWRDHASIYVAGGRGATPDDESLDHWAGSASFEVLRRGFIAEARVEHFRVPEYLQYRTARVGRLSHPLPVIAGGVTIGYREVRGPRAHDGLEIGFPFIAGHRAWWMRFETAYVLSTRQSSWNYRLQSEWLLGRGPFIVGFAAELQAWEIRRRGRLSPGTLAVLLGMTSRWQ